MGPAMLARTRTTVGPAMLTQEAPSWSHRPLRRPSGALSGDDSPVQILGEDWRERIAEAYETTAHVRRPSFEAWRSGRYGMVLFLECEQGRAACDNKEICMHLSTRWGSTEPAPFQWFSERMKNTVEVMAHAIQQHGCALQYGGPAIRDCKELVLKAMATCEVMFEFASDRLRDDEDMVVKALQHDAMNLEYASQRLRDDLHICSVASLKHEASLRFASFRVICCLNNWDPSHFDC